jgi:hypothetical protein
VYQLGHLGLPLPVALDNDLPSPSEWPLCLAGVAACHIAPPFLKDEGPGDVLLSAPRVLLKVY